MAERKLFKAGDIVRCTGKVSFNEDSTGTRGTISVKFEDYGTTNYIPRDKIEFVRKDWKVLDTAVWLDPFGKELAVGIIAIDGDWAWVMFDKEHTSQTRPYHTVLLADLIDPDDLGLTMPPATPIEIPAVPPAEVPGVPDGFATGDVGEF